MARRVLNSTPGGVVVGAMTDYALVGDDHDLPGRMRTHVTTPFFLGLAFVKR
jgi:hypothetical protein